MTKGREMDGAWILHVFKKEKNIASPLPWVLVFRAKTSVFDVIAGLSEEIWRTCPGRLCPPRSWLRGSRGSYPGLITVFVTQLFFWERQFSAALLWRSGTWSCFSSGEGKDSDEDEVLVLGWWVRPKLGGRCCRGCPPSPDPGFVGDILRGRGAFRRAMRLPGVSCRDPVGL